MKNSLNNCDMEELYNKALNICRLFIGAIPVVTDEQINTAIEQVSFMPDFKMLDKHILKKKLLAHYGVRIQDFQILEGNDRRLPWLKEFKANKISNWNFWTRYKLYLSEQKGYAPAVINQLDEITDRILDNLFNPQQVNISIDKKGLVVGQVQSGKTANYTGLICKAADAGFNFIIVLAGIHNNLRSQTQSRIDEGFLGFDTQYERAYSINSTTKIGVGLIPGFDSAIANSYTTSIDKGDFNSRAANTAGFNFNAPQPIILVVKKNASVLKRLYKWLCAQTSGKKQISNKSLLLIDDEADNASINTKKDKDTDPTAINDNIRKIIQLFNRSAYVGYTATPFANIFIAQDETDLFPRDFIINLPAPDNYIGPNKVFGTSSETSEEEDDVLPIVIPIDDYKAFIPDGHKKDDKKPTKSDIPESLKLAIKCFILTCAIRRARGQENKHNSMLIHVSRYQVWQNEIRDIAASGITQYACPGVCGWNRWMPLMYNSYLNIRTMCHHAHKYNAIGLLNTDWGDYGHVNDPRLTIPGILYGAAFGWNAEPVEFDELNEAVSRLYYGDTTGQFAGLMAKLQDYEVFDWRNTVNWIECDEKTRAEILSEVDFTRIDDANRAVEKAKADILAAAVNLPAGKKQIVQVLCQTADIIVLWNRIGAWLNAGCPHGPEADAMAAALEHWLQRYRAQWRQVSKESSLSVLTNLICRYADLLRGRAYGTVEAPAGR